MKLRSYSAIAVGLFVVACGDTKDPKQETPEMDAGLLPTTMFDSSLPIVPDAGHDSGVIEPEPPPPAGRLAWTGGGGYDEFPVTSNAHQKVRAADTTMSSMRVGSVDATIASLELLADGSLKTHFATFLGGGGRDVGMAAVLDADSNLYVVGTTSSVDFPTLAAVQMTFAGKQDVWVAKFSSTGALVFSTYLGGTGFDDATDIAVDATGVYVVGATMSADFPTIAGVVQPVFGGATAGFADDGNGDVFVTKLALDGQLLWSTYLGGNESDTPTRIALDSSGNPVIIGATVSDNFPTTATAHQPMHAAAEPGLPVFVLNDDAFVTKLAADGKSVLASTFFGGNRRDAAASVVLTATDVYVAVMYESKDIPNASAPTAREKYLVAKLSADLSELTAQMVLETTADFPAQVIALAAGTNDSLAMLVYAGDAFSLPGQPNVMPAGADHPYGVARVASDLASVSSVVFPTDIAVGTPHAFAVDEHDRPHVLMLTEASTFVTTGSKHAGGFDGHWAALVKDGSSVKSGSYFGGTGNDDARRCHFAF